LLILAGCGNERKRNIPADVINNPNSASGTRENVLPVIEFEKDLHDFGKLIAGEKAVFTFKFKNAGKSDLVISQVKSSCGCTVPKFTKDPIEPGGEGQIKVTFDSSGRSGIQNKAITVVYNGQPNSAIVRIKAQVISP
jgi:hypothetical protein